MPRPHYAGALQKCLGLSHNSREGAESPTTLQRWGLCHWAKWRLKSDILFSYRKVKTSYISFPPDLPTEIHITSSITFQRWGWKAESKELKREKNWTGRGSKCSLFLRKKFSYLCMHPSKDRKFKDRASRIGYCVCACMFQMEEPW